MKLLISPHNDDEALFASYIALRERPKVIVCFNGRRKRDYPTADVRAAESAAAMSILGCKFEHLGLICDPPDWDELEQLLRDMDPQPEHVWAPLPEAHGNRGHSIVGELAEKLWPGRVTFYATYTMGEDGWPIKSTVGELVSVEPGWPERKREALDCYRTQIANPATRMHFEQNLDEYIVEPAMVIA